MSVQHLFCLKGRKALVTGSSRGIGRAIAFALGEAGASVVFHGMAKTPKLKQTLEEAREKGFSCSFVTGDLGDSAALHSLAEECGHIDILVLNASIQKYQTVLEFNEEDFLRQFTVNVGASFELIRTFLPGMEAQSWGRVLSIGSVNQWKQSPRLPAYAASKSALVNLIQNCARTCAAKGVTFNNLAPGIIATDRNREALADDGLVEKLLAGVPARRFGTPEDCAGLALLLCSEAGSYITGCDIPIAGGMQL